MSYFIYNPNEDGFLMSYTENQNNRLTKKYLWGSLKFLKIEAEAFVLTDEVLYNTDHLGSIMILLRGIGLNDKELKHLHIVPNQMDMGGWWPEFYEAFEFGEHAGIYYR